MNQTKKMRLRERFYCPNILRSQYFTPFCPPPSTPEENEIILPVVSQEVSLERESEIEEHPETTSIGQFSVEDHPPSAYMPCPRGKLLLKEVLRQLYCPIEKYSIEAYLARFDVPSGHGASDDNSDEEEAGEQVCVIM